MRQAVEYPCHVYEIASRENKEIASLSWGGFNIFGDSKSIAEVASLLSARHWAECIQSRLQEEHARVIELEAEVANYRQLQD